MKFYVFVYGTLKRGFCLHKYLQGATFLGEAYLDGFEMYDLGSYPGIVSGKGRVWGEVYAVGPGTLAVLDEIEDEGEEYERRLVRVRLKKGQDLEAFVYVYKGDVSRARQVSSGKWSKGRGACLVG